MERDRKHGDLTEGFSSVRRKLINEGKIVIARRKNLQSMVNASVEARESAVTTHNSDITSIAYREKPFIYDFLDAQREIYSLRPKVQVLYQQGVITDIDPSSLKKEGLFEQKFKGLSFMDIENMQVDRETHELAPEDIRRLNRMFRSQNLLGLGKDKTHTYALEHLIYFASQQWTHPEIGVPRSLRKFHENITAYFDYYTKFLTDFKRDPLNERSMMIMLALGRLFLSTAVGTYAVGRLNITPSSAVKLHKQREALASDINLKLAWKRLEKYFLPVFKKAYRNDALLEDLEQYQHYDEEIDSIAADRLRHYIQQTASTEEQIQRKDEAKGLMEQWVKHKRDIVREMMRHLKKRLEYQISGNHPAEKVTVVRNRDTFVFILHFPDNVHLTLELDKTGKLFGVPPSLIKAYPHVNDTLIVDILKPLLEKYKAKDTPVFKISAASLKPPIADDLETLEEVTGDEDLVIKPPKRKRLVQAFTIFEQDPLPPITPLAPKVQRFVVYSEDDVRRLLGPQVSRQQSVVDRVLGAIYSFEHGYIDSKMLTASGPIIRIRVGDYRILMERLGAGNYSIKQIVNRKDAPY